VEARSEQKDLEVNKKGIDF